MVRGLCFLFNCFFGGFSLNTYKCSHCDSSHCDKVLYHKTVRAKPWTLFHNLNYVWLHQVFFSFCLVIQFCGAYGLFYNFSFYRKYISPIRSILVVIPFEHTTVLLDLLSGTSFVVFLCAKHLIFYSLVYDLQQDLRYFTTKLSDTT